VCDHPPKSKTCKAREIKNVNTLKMAERYTRGADQVQLAEAVMHRLASERPTEEDGVTFSAENEEKSMPFPAVGAQERTRTSTALTTST
jgi:hypothetical protein